MDETRFADPHTLLLKAWTIWQDSLRLSDSHLTCKVETNSRCQYLVDIQYLKMYIYISISAGNYLYSYIIIPATIKHNNVYTITYD